MLNLTIPPAPDSFQPVMRPRPTPTNGRRDLTPRHYQQYQIFLHWEDENGNPAERPPLDPDVEAFIKRRDSFDQDELTWMRERDIERVIQWSRYYLAHLPQAFLVLEVATPILAALYARTDLLGIKNDILAHDATMAAQHLIAACGIPVQP